MCIKELQGMRLLAVAIMLSALVCVSPEGLQCYYCEPNTFCFVDTQYQCPPHSSSPAGSDDLILVTGSLYVVGEARRVLGVGSRDEG